MFLRPQHLHFIGIGGIGMSGIAEVLLNLGFPISGSDLKRSPITDRLAQHGARIFEGHAAAHLQGAKAVVVSSAVDPSNPEVLEARRRQIPVIPRGEMLAELMRLKYGIAVAGSHGKTTTTSLITAVMRAGGLDPTVVVGGKFRELENENARLGRSDFLVVESDESDRSFLKLAPIVAVVTNIDREHLDCYSSIEDIRSAFAQFVNKVPFYGVAILCLDDENVQRLLPEITRRTFTYGQHAQADLRVTALQCHPFGSSFHLSQPDKDLGPFQLHAPGVHNALNAAAAAAVGLELGVSVEHIRQGLAGYGGVERRFQVKGKEAGITVIDDYGHHPTEIKATLSAARTCEFRRVIALFQPHRYSRTHHLLEDFALAFYLADLVFVLDIYAASEKPLEGVSGQLLVERLRAHGHRGAEFSAGMDQAVDSILALAAEGDAIVTLGAGNVWQAGERILQRLRKA